MRPPHDAPSQQHTEECGPVHADFKKRFTPHVSSTLAPPFFPSDFIKLKTEKTEATAAVPAKLTLNFFLPHEQQMKAKEARL